MTINKATTITRALTTTYHFMVSETNIISCLKSCVALCDRNGHKPWNRVGAYFLDDHLLGGMALGKGSNCTWGTGNYTWGPACSSPSRLESQLRNCGWGTTLHDPHGFGSSDISVRNMVVHLIKFNYWLFSFSSFFKVVALLWNWILELLLSCRISNYFSHQLYWTELTTLNSPKL